MRKKVYEEFIKKYEDGLKVCEECMKKQEEEIKHLKKCIKELKDKESEDSIWIPEYREEYWMVFIGECRVYRAFWRNSDIDKKRLNVGNVHKTQEEAMFKLEKMKVLEELKKFSCKYRKGELNYYISLNSNTNELLISLSYIYMRFDFYFESYEKAKEAIEEVGEDRIKKYLFEVEEYKEFLNE